MLKRDGGRGHLHLILNVEAALHPWNKLQLIVEYDYLFIAELYLLILVKIFASIFMWGIVL